MKTGMIQLIPRLLRQLKNRSSAMMIKNAGLKERYIMAGLRKPVYINKKELSGLLQFANGQENHAHRLIRILVG